MDEPRGDKSGPPGGLTAMAVGSFNPEISDTFTVTPAVVYSPIVPVAQFATNRLVPEIAMPMGRFKPEISEALMVAPEVVYSPIVPFPSFTTNRLVPDTAMP